MINSISCIIIDDEPKAIELLKESLSYLYPAMDIIGTYTSWKTALEALREKPSDILFSDISLPGKNSMEILKLIPELDSEIVFITAHADYALKAFQFSTAGYILKPIDDGELKSAVDKAITRVRNKKLAKLNAEPAVYFNSKVGIPNGKGVDYVEVNDIIYLESVNKCTNVCCKKEDILSAYNIGRFKSLLDKYPFYQVHRSFIVNLNCIRRYESGGSLIMINNKEIPISKNEREQFQQVFGNIVKKLPTKNED